MRFIIKIIFQINKIQQLIYYGEFFNRHQRGKHIENKHEYDGKDGRLDN